MKELDEKKVDVGQTAADHRPVESRRLVQRMRLQPGHRVWELELDTGLIREGSVERVDVEVGKDGRPGDVRRRVMMREGCIYCTALNAVNAEKRFLKMIVLHKVMKHGNEIGSSSQG